MFALPCLVLPCLACRRMNNFEKYNFTFLSFLFFLWLSSINFFLSNPLVWCLLSTSSKIYWCEGMFLTLFFVVFFLFFLLFPLLLQLVYLLLLLLLLHLLSSLSELCISSFPHLHYHYHCHIKHLKWLIMLQIQLSYLKFCLWEIYSFLFYTQRKSVATRRNFSNSIAWKEA